MDINLVELDSLAKIKRAAVALVEDCDKRYGQIEKDIENFCKEYSDAAGKKTPELLVILEESYIVGQSIVNSMMAGNRYVSSTTGRYSDALKNIDTLEAKIALAAWERWYAAMEKWKEAHPVPDGFWWNGAILSYQRPL